MWEDRCGAPFGKRLGTLNDDVFTFRKAFGNDGPAILSVSDGHRPTDSFGIGANRPDERTALEFGNGDFWNQDCGIKFFRWHNDSGKLAGAKNVSGIGEPGFGENAARGFFNAAVDGDETSFFGMSLSIGPDENKVRGALSLGQLNDPVEIFRSEEVVFLGDGKLEIHGIKIGESGDGGTPGTSGKKITDGKICPADQSVDGGDDGRKFEVECRLGFRSAGSFDSRLGREIRLNGILVILFAGGFCLVELGLTFFVGLGFPLRGDGFCQFRAGLCKGGFEGAGIDAKQDVSFAYLFALAEFDGGDETGDLRPYINVGRAIEAPDKFAFNLNRLFGGGRDSHRGGRNHRWSLLLAGGEDA